MPGNSQAASQASRSSVISSTRPAHPGAARFKPAEFANIQALPRWLEHHGLNADQWSSRDLGEVIQLAKTRREALRQLIATAPGLALREALPWATRQRLPAEVRVHLEELVAGTGRFAVFCPQPKVNPDSSPDSEPVSRPGMIREVTMGDQSYRAFVYGRRNTQLTVESTALYGVAIDDLLAASEDPLRIVSSEEATALMGRDASVGGDRCALTGEVIDAALAPVLVQHGADYLRVSSLELARQLNQRLASTEPGFLRPTEPPQFSEWSHGIKRLLFMRARFPDDLREPISEAEAAEVMRQANEYFVAASCNSLSIISTIGPLVTLPQPKLYYAVRGPGRLLEDARAATRLAGIDWEAFELDMVRFESVPGFDWGGLGAVGGRGVWLQGSGLGVVVHELGHNLGLGHANFWNTVRPEPPEDTQNLPFDADSLVGIDSVIGPGDDVEYGDPFDVMGGGGGPEAHFTALHKILLGWIPSGGVAEVTGSGLYRILPHDLGVLSGDGTYALRVRKDFERSYWISARSRFTANPWLSHGLELHWNNWHQAIGSSELLDTTPGSGPEKEDAALILGRTFTDAAAEIAITPVRRDVLTVGDRNIPFYDVYVSVGSLGSNTAPSLELGVSSLTASPGQPVIFTAGATDPDGDSLVFSWLVEGGEPGRTSSTITNQWNTPGDYVVRCEVTDMRGGTASRHTVIRVGAVATLRITGQVIDQSGQPLAGVRVHNGQAGTNSPHAEDYRWAVTDSNGRYTLTGLTAGSYSVGAFLGGYTARPLNFSRPLILNEFTGVNVDFIATALPRVSVTAVDDGSESPAGAVFFQLTRDGPTNDALRVYFRTTGSAAPDEDYESWPNTETQTNVIATVLDPVNQLITFSYVDLPPGVLTTNLSFPVLSDTTAEGDETLVLTLSYPVSRMVVSETETNYFDIPGWEIMADNGQDTWFQTRPYYHLGPRDEAVGRIRDAAAPVPTTISITALDPEVSENSGDSASFLISRLGSPPTNNVRLAVRLSGSATAGEDYLGSTTDIMLSPAVDAARIRVEVLDDDFVEGNETITATVSPGDGYRLGAASATVELVDNDLPLVTVNAVDSVISESASGARIAFQRSGDVEHPLDVDYLVSGTASAGGDYEALSGRVTIPAGSSSAIVSLVPRDDGVVEGDETVVVQVGDSPVYNASAPGRAVITLQDDESPIVTVEATVDETTEGGESGVFTLRRTGSLGSRLVVHYTLGGSAIHQADYVASGDQIEIPAGQMQANIQVLPIDDAYREDDETIAIEIRPDPSYSLGTPARAAIRLVDNGDAEPAVGFALLSSSGPESRTDPELAVRISGNPDEGDDTAVTVAWEVLGGTARLGQDYVLTNGTLVFPYADPEGDEPLSNRVAFIPLQVVNDRILETDETIVVRLRIAPTTLASEDPEAPPNVVTNGILDIFAVHTYTIIDDDLGLITVTASESSTAEGSGLPARFTVQRTGATERPQEVRFHLSGLATPGNDYVNVPLQLTIPAGRRSADILITPIDDPVSEYRENVILTLIDAPNASVGNPATAEVAIDDNDGTIEFTQARWEVNEGDGVSRIMVRRTGNTNLSASAVFSVTPGTAQGSFITNDLVAGDFVVTNGTVSFLPGEVLRSFDIRVLQDTEIESPETIRLQLSRGSDLFPLGGQNTAVLTIFDDDAFLSTGTNAAAGIESDFQVEVTLTRNGPVTEAARLSYVTADDSAIAGQDYVTTEGSVEFRPGDRSVTVRVQLLNDLLIEGDENFMLRFLDESGEVAGQVPVVIVDDDCSVQFAIDATAVDEDGGVVELLVQRIGSGLKPFLVDFATVEGSALAGADFAATNGSLRFLGNRLDVLTNGTGEVVFLPGESNKVFTIPIINDSDGERDESFRVILANARPDTGFLTPYVVLGAVTNMTVTILDNEAPGRLDDRFQPGLGADDSVRALLVQKDGKVLVGGDFTTMDGVILPRLGRLHADGFLDRSFNPGLGFDGSVRAIAEVEGGRILVGGTFTGFDGRPRPNLTVLEPDGTGSLEPVASVDGAVNAIAVGNGIFIGGDFTRVSAIAGAGVAKLKEDRLLDEGFSTGGAGRSGVRALSVTTEGGLWVGGSFTTWGGNGRYLVRLLPDGTMDRSFGVALSPNGPVTALLAGVNGMVFVAGEFTTISGVPRPGLARLQPNGLVDSSFQPRTAGNDAVLAMGIQGSDRVVVAGAFTTFDEIPAGRFARLDSNASVDPTFFRGLGANDLIRAVAVQPDGAFLIGGDFTTVNGRARLRIARIHADEEFAEGFVEFAAAAFSSLESAAESTIQVRRTGSAKTEARVRYLTVDSTATAGADYVSSAGELVFQAGETAASFIVPLRDDALSEGTETVTLVLTNSVGAVIGRQATAELLLEDDEAAIAFERASVEVSEGAGSVNLVVRRSGPLGSDAQVSYLADGLTAAAGEDFAETGGTLIFPAGIGTNSVSIQILQDDDLEGPELFELRLSSPSGGLDLGTQSAVTVRILDDDQAPTSYALTIQSSPGGIVVPGGGRYPTNSVQSLLAIPDRGFEFARWEGTIVSIDNPLDLLMDRDHVLTARFVPRDYLATFESGKFDELPWVTTVGSPWTVTDETSSSGRYSARSGVVGDRGTSILSLTYSTGRGTGAFDFRTASEAGWDFLEFYLNGQRVERWSGLQGWQTFTFNIPAGTNRLEWHFSRDPTFGGAEDAVWIDNLDLPDAVEEVPQPRLTLIQSGTGWALRVDGAGSAVPMVLEESSDLRVWVPVAIEVTAGTPIPLSSVSDSGSRVRFYRVKVPQ